MGQGGGGHGVISQIETSLRVFYGMDIMVLFVLHD